MLDRLPGIVALIDANPVYLYFGRRIAVTYDAQNIKKVRRDERLSSVTDETYSSRFTPPGVRDCQEWR